MNLLRLIFALFVLIAHSYLIGSYKHNIPEQAFYFLDLAVPMFFVVLGYLITASANWSSHCPIKKNENTKLYQNNSGTLYNFICFVRYLSKAVISSGFIS